MEERQMSIGGSKGEEDERKREAWWLELVR